MSPLLLTAVVLIFAIGLAHSYLGEKYILIRLFRRDNLPRLFGDDRFTKQTLRFAWHPRLWATPSIHQTRRDS